MNIFYLDKDPVKAAQAHFDKHVRKQILEAAQILSTAHRVLDGESKIIKDTRNYNYTTWILNDERQDILYKSSHVNHPSTIWARESKENYKYTYDLLVALLEEYTYRWGAIHQTSNLLEELKNFPKNIPNIPMTEFRKVVGEVKIEEPVEAYKEYYRVYKQSLKQYTKRKEPLWLEGETK